VSVGPGGPTARTALHPVRLPTDDGRAWTARSPIVPWGGTNGG
jgi:hypothetical protein